MFGKRRRLLLAAGQAIPYATAAGTVAAGTVATINGWGEAGPSFAFGLTLLIIGALFATAIGAFKFITRPARSIDEAFEAGFELGESKGYKAGRACPRLTVVQMRTTCHHCGEDTPVTPVRRAG